MRRMPIALLMAFLLALPGHVFGADNDDNGKGDTGKGAAGSKRATEEVHKGSLFSQIVIGVGIVVLVILVASDDSDTALPHAPADSVIDC